MQTRTATVDLSLYSDSISRNTSNFPLHVFPVTSGFIQTAEDVLLSVVPQHRFAKDQSERHLVDQRLQGSRGSAGSRKVRVGPSPEVPMPVSTVVSLDSESQRVPSEAPAIECDLRRKHCIGMRRARETDPAFVAQRHAKSGTVIQVPRDRVTINFQGSPTRILVNLVVADSEVKR